MPSIFIWKSDVSYTSRDTIRQYIGANWVLEDFDTYSNSYQFQQQIGLNINNTEVLINNAKLMPTDWIGSELLEVIQVPYKFIKSDNYANYDILGNWNRVILKNTINNLTEELCSSEFTNIINWISNHSTIKHDNKSHDNKLHNHNTNNKKYPIKDNIKKPSLIKSPNTLPTINNICNDFLNIHSFEETILKLNNITKEQLLNFNNLSSNNLIHNNLVNSSSINHVIHNKPYHKHNKQYKVLNIEQSNNYNNKSVKIMNNFENGSIIKTNIMSIPLCSI